MPSPLYFAILFGFIIWFTAYSMRPQAGAGTLFEPDVENLESVTVCYRKERVWVGGVLMLGPLIIVPRILKEYAKPEHGEAFGFACLMVCMMLLGAWLFAYARRRIIFDREGAKIIGLAPKRIAWEELGSIKTTYGKIVRFFAKDGKLSIDIDSTMQGFPTLVRVLPRLTTGRARKLVVQAWTEIEAATPRQAE